MSKCSDSKHRETWAPLKIKYQNTNPASDALLNALFDSECHKRQDSSRKNTLGIPC